MREFSGRVVEGKRLGRALGFPTANLETDCAPELKYGVYAVVVETESGRFRGMMNVGAHPTAPEGRPTIEIHLLDFEGDLYEHTIRVEPLAFLRGEKRFESLGMLKKQLERDRETVRGLIDQEKLSK